MNDFAPLLRDYALDARERLDRVEQWLLTIEMLGHEERASQLARLKAELHTLKGNSGMMGLTELQQAAHRMEDVVVGVASAPLDVAALLLSKGAKINTHSTEFKESALTLASGKGMSL